MNKYIIYILGIILCVSLFSCKRNESANHQIVGSWSAKYVIINGEGLLGYLDDNLTYHLKPTVFTENNKLVIFLENDNKQNIEANYAFKGNDSIHIESSINDISGSYKIELIEKQGKRVMKLKASKKEMYFEQVSARISF